MIDVSSIPVAWVLNEMTITLPMAVLLKFIGNVTNGTITLEQLA
jgi:hypothetical protein